MKKTNCHPGIGLGSSGSEYAVEVWRQTSPWVWHWTQFVCLPGRSLEQVRKEYGEPVDLGSGPMPTRIVLKQETVIEEVK